MLKFLSTILLLLNLLDGNCQEQMRGNLDTFNFINQVIKDKRSHIYLYSNVHLTTIADIRRHIKKGKFVRRIEDECGNDLSDSIVLTKVELKLLLYQLETYRNFRWTEKSSSSINFGRLTLMTFDTVSRLYESDVKYQIVPPLFFRGGEYCLFYYDYYCGPLCGQGQLVLYKREKDVWKRWRTLHGWNS